MRLYVLAVTVGCLPWAVQAQAEGDRLLPSSLKGHWEGASVLSDFPATTPLCELELGDFYRDPQGDLAVKVNGWTFRRPEGCTCRAFVGPPFTAGSAPMRLDLGPNCERLLWWTIPVESPYENNCYFGLTKSAEP